MAFLHDIGLRTKSMLLATATPVQLHPVEAWDLLKLLSHGNDGVLGGWTQNSPWFKPSRCLKIATGEMSVPTNAVDGWQFVRDPLPRVMNRVKRRLSAIDSAHPIRSGDSVQRLSPTYLRYFVACNLRMGCCRAMATSSTRCFVASFVGHVLTWSSR